MTMILKFINLPQIFHNILVKCSVNHRYIKGITKAASIQHPLTILSNNTCSNTTLWQKHNVLSEQKQRYEHSSQNTSPKMPKLSESSHNYAIRHLFEIPFKTLKYTAYMHNQRSASRPCCWPQKLFRLPCEHVSAKHECLPPTTYLKN